MDKIKFGTDGWRGIISDDFTFDNVRRVAVAVSKYYKSQSAGPKRIAIGYDTRFLSGDYAHVISQVLASKGIEVILSHKPIPTPALSFAVKVRNMTAGVMVTASHNPHNYNGIKIKTSSGGAAPSSVTRKIEKRLSARLPAVASPRNSDLIMEKDLTGDYIEFLRSYLNLDLFKKCKFRVLVDVMYGSGNGFIANVLDGTGIKLDFVRNQINPSFGGLRPEPVLENLGPCINQLRQQRYDLGLVLDGDADRIAAFAGADEFIHPQQILGLLILHLVCNRQASGGVVKTIAGSTLIDKIAKHLGLKLYETPVGFKYISGLMQEHDILVGGEEAGGMGFKGYIPERDGSLAGLLLLEMMAYQKKPMQKILRKMEEDFGKYYYLREDIHLTGAGRKIKNNLTSKINRFKTKKDLLGRSVVHVKDFDGVKLICNDESWLMLRASGTEPLVRVYSEAKTINRARQLLDFGRDFIRLFP